jgi:GDP-4-dehydro-6-deoxy-D-mannose reductase
LTSPSGIRSLAESRVLVTGASGFVGRHLVHVLGARGAAVVGVGTEPAAPFEGLATWRVADLTDAASVGAAVADDGAEAIVHLAGQASAGLSFHEAERTFRVNVLGTWHLLQAVATHAPQARVLIVGSGEAYGPQPEGSRVAEDAPFRPVSPYAFSKAAADALAESFHLQRGLDVLRTRSFSHAGPGQSARFAMPSFALQIAAMERAGAGGVLKVGNLEVVRDVLDVRDVVECYAQLLESGVAGRAYNVCSGAGVPLTRVVAMLTGLSRVPVRVEVDPVRVRPADVPYLVGDPARVAGETRWAPRYDLETTLRDLLDQCRAEPREV